jgi:hypothetical protein
MNIIESVQAGMRLGALERAGYLRFYPTNFKRSHDTSGTRKIVSPQQQHTTSIEAELQVQHISRDFGEDVSFPSTTGSSIKELVDSLLLV